MAAVTDPVKVGELLNAALQRYGISPKTDMTTHGLASRVVSFYYHFRL